ncbi:hypothetical protein D046_8239B, partial [Vibrio parahaemolyticus V-223/04]
NAATVARAPLSISDW